MKVYAETVKALGYEHTIVVYGAGLDEVAVHGERRLRKFKTDRSTITP